MISWCPHKPGLQQVSLEASCKQYSVRRNEPQGASTRHLATLLGTGRDILPSLASDGKNWLSGANNSGNSAFWSGANNSGNSACWSGANNSGNSACWLSLFDVCIPFSSSSLSRSSPSIFPSGAGWYGCEPMSLPDLWWEPGTRPLGTWLL